jgi:hypothetical protein
MKTREKKGKTKIRGKNIFLKKFKRERQTRSGVAYNPLIIKRKIFSFGLRFQIQLYVFFLELA